MGQGEYVFHLKGKGGSMWSVRGHKEGGGYVVRLRRKGKVCGASEGIWRMGGGVMRSKSMETRNYFEKTLHMSKI